jgi:hypothetical protein
MAAVAAALVAAAAAYHLAVRPALRRTETLLRVIAEKEEALRQVSVMGAEHRALREDIEAGRRRIAQQPKDFSALAYLEAASKETGLSQFVTHMKPSSAPAEGGAHVETRVEIKGERAPLPALVAFLEKAQAAPGFIVVRELTLQRSRPSPSAFDALIVVASLTPAEKR